MRHGGPKLRRSHPLCADPRDGVLVALYRDSRNAPLVDMRRRLKAALDAISKSGFTVARATKPTDQRPRVVRLGPNGTATQAQLDLVSGVWGPAAW